MARSGQARLIVWGGSAVGTPALIKALRSRLLPGEGLDVVLVGRTAGRIEVVGELCRKLAEVCRGDLRVSYTDDIVGSLEGADYILNQVRVGGLSGRLFDEAFPRDLGIPGEETVGPGGFSSATRTIPVILEYCRLAEQKAPHALILNLTNPSSHVQYAIRRYTSMAVLGVCDMPVRMARKIAQVLGISHAELDFDYVGMHHAGWVTGVRHLGRDVLPQLLERAEQVEADVDPSLIRAVGAIPSRYFRYYFHPDRMLAKTDGKKYRAEELMDTQAELLAEYARPDAHERPDIGAQRGAAWHDLIVVPVLLSLIRDSRKRFIVNIDNGSTIPWLPSEAIIEVLCTVGASGAHPLQVGAVPADVRAWLQCNCTYEMLAVQAIVERSYDLAMRALLLNPLISGLDVARAVLDRVWPADWTG
jgi:6-phospho-beta-glucosidase